MSKQLNFFMTKEDLLILSDELKNKMDIAFYDLENIISADGRRFNTVKELPNLGINRCGSHHIESFLVLPRDKEVVIEEITLKNGKIHYIIVFVKK